MPGNAPPIITVENLTAGYDGVVVVKDVSFEVRRGEVFVILGGSGCGKSTLMKHMIGLHEPISGRVIIDGDDLAAADGERRRRILQKLGVTYQSGALFGSMSLLGNISLPLEEFTDLPRDAVKLVAAMKLRTVGLEGYGDHAPSAVSGGMRKRAALARAMALDPEILLLDEPTAGLDPVTAREIDELILHLAAGLNATFVVVTHELPSIYAIADRAIMLDGRTKGIIASGRPHDLRNSADPQVRRFFEREVKRSTAPSRSLGGSQET